MRKIATAALDALRQSFAPLIGLKISWLSIPNQALVGFEPSQIAVIVNTLLDGILPQIELLATDPENAERLKKSGLSKSPGIIGEREAYPDYVHVSGRRVELKGLFIDNPDLKLKRPPTRREPSARLKENITLDKIDPENDALLIAAVQLREEDGYCYPFIIDIGVFFMIECIRARDKRLAESGGKWFAGVPKVISKSGLRKQARGEKLTARDYKKDTNFGKLKRIPYPPLQEFLRRHGAI